MTSPAILSRLTAASCDPARFHAGGIPEHENAEIMGALAKVSPEAQYYAAVFFRGCDEYRGRIMDEIRFRLAEIGAKKGWEIRKPGILEGMAWLAMAEESPEASRCPTCGGIGNKTIRFQIVECRPCGGTGRRKYEHPHQFLGIHRANWHRVWKPRYERHVRPLLDDWRWEIRLALSRELRGWVVAQFENARS